jgi:hypothetical protein
LIIISVYVIWITLSSLFNTEHIERVQEYGFKFNEAIASLSEGYATLTDGREIPLHSKITMLVNPFKWMKGEFGTIGMPMPKLAAEKVYTKLQSHNNAGYVGCILSVALSQSDCQHFPTVYGVYTGIDSNHKIDISDDYEELSERSWFSTNIGKTFELKLDEHIGTTIEYTRNRRSSLMMGENINLDDVQVLESIQATDPRMSDMSRVFKEEEVDEDDDKSSSVSTSYIFQIESMASSFDGSIDEDEEDESFAWAYFKNVPVQVTLMEKLNGTLYDLLKNHPEPEKHYAWLAQVIFALAYAQRNFAFTHNDLHGNNIMFVTTPKQFLYYFHSGVSYAVPTYGYLLKIIDFDRSIGSIKLNGMKEPKLFMSDQFRPDEEAGGQYNSAPFHTSSYAIIKPNPSFDLVRLATSLFWDLFPEGPDYIEYQEQDVFKLFIKWMTLEDGSSVLFFKNNPKVDRYIGFSLYKAIARYCKDTAIPRKEIVELKTFIGSVPSTETALVIDI